MTEGSLLEKLVGEIGRYNNKAFLKATMAVCALTATADDEVSLAEHYRIDEIIAKEPTLKQLDAEKATNTLYDYIHAVRSYGDSARRVLYGKVQRMAGDHKKSRTLMRVAYLVIIADREIREAEREEFRRLCGALGLEPDEVWRELAG
jgi:tellurite resistance protein TerB